MPTSIAPAIHGDHPAALRLVRRAIELYADMLDQRGGQTTATRLRATLPARLQDVASGSKSDTRRALQAARTHARRLNSDVGRRRAAALRAITDVAADVLEDVALADLQASVDGLVDDLAEAGRGDGYIAPRVADIQERRRRQQDMPWADRDAVAADLAAAAAG